jgi:hypothetical protein
LGFSKDLSGRVGCVRYSGLKSMVKDQDIVSFDFAGSRVAGADLPGHRTGSIAATTNCRNREDISWPRVKPLQPLAERALSGG